MAARYGSRQLPEISGVDFGMYSQLDLSIVRSNGCEIRSGLLALFLASIAVYGCQILPERMN